MGSWSTSVPFGVMPQKILARPSLMQPQVVSVDTRFDAVDSRLTGIDMRNGVIETRLESIGGELSRTNNRQTILRASTLTLLAITTVGVLGYSLS
ncbi:MAG TPA: hypothetical protein EYN53_01770 [Dehalococcoidia bacterium]|jgi:hypothetical protein|nr:hypothetical protein [Dehalococcoidia bacterium]